MVGRKNNNMILKGYWRSRKYISENLLREKEKIVSWILKGLNIYPISKIEYHYIALNKLNIIIYYSGGIKRKLEGEELLLVNGLLEKLFNKKINLLFINLSYPYLDAQILAQYILYKYSIRAGLSGHSIHSIINLIRTNEIKGIRVEIKGLSGKMAMSKKLIKSVGINQHNSSNSIIDYGFAKLLNKKGIIGIKVWINYSPKAWTL
jgi:ribosomal protein S3